MLKRISILLVLAVLVMSSTMWAAAQPEPDFPTYLPFIVRAEGTPQPPSGDNVVCSSSGTTQLCAWVSSGNPQQRTTVTVYGRLMNGSAGQANQTMNTIWHYKTTTSTCSGVTGQDGIASCSRQIGAASIGYRVNIDVTIGGKTVTTWFTPQ